MVHVNNLHGVICNLHEVVNLQGEQVICMNCMGTGNLLKGIVTEFACGMVK